MTKEQQRIEWRKYFEIFNERAREAMRDNYFIDFDFDHPKVIKETWKMMKKYWEEIQEELELHPLVSFEVHKMEMEG